MKPNVSINSSHDDEQERQPERQQQQRPTNLWNRFRDAISVSHNNNNNNSINNDDDEHEPLLINPPNHAYRHQISLVDGDGETDSYLPVNNDLNFLYNGESEQAGDEGQQPQSPTSDKDSLLGGINHNNSTKKSKSKDGKYIIDVPIYGAIEDSQHQHHESSRRRTTSSGRQHHHHRQGSRQYKHYMGLILTLLSSVFSSLSGLTVKLLEDDYHPSNICFWRFVHVFLIATCYLVVSRLWSTKAIWPTHIFQDRSEHLKHAFILILRGVLGCSGRILYIYSITCLTLADSMVIASSTPVFMSFFAYFLIGEACGLIPILIGLLTVVGVGIIARPPFITGEVSYNTTILLGTLTGISGMLLTTLVMITMRKLRHIHHSLITMSFAFFGLIASAILAVYNGVFVVPSGSYSILIMYFSGLTSFFGQTFLTLGLKYEDAGPVALLKNFDVIFAFIWEFIFLHVAPDVYSLGGGCLVIFCIVLTTVRKWLSTLPEEDELRSTFSVMLK